MTVQTERRTKTKSAAKWYLAGPLVCALSLPALLYLCAVLLAREVLPFELMEELVIACVFACATLGALAACAVRKRRVMQTGFATGCMLAAALVILALAAPGEGALTALCLRHVIAAMAGGAFGGALSIRRGDRPKRRRGKK